MSEKQLVLDDLKDYPHIQQFLDQHWDHPDLVIDYVKKLLNDTRDHKRKGFPHATAETLLVFFNRRRDVPPLMEENFKVNE